MSPTRREPEPDRGRTTNDRLKLELRDLAIRMDVLLQEGRRLCRESEPDRLSASAAVALDGIEMNNDFLLAITDDRSPGPFVVRVEIPGTDEPVRLEAVWNDDVSAYRLTNVPIGLAVVARAIDASLADRHSNLRRHAQKPRQAKADCISPYSSQADLQDHSGVAPMQPE